MSHTPDGTDSKRAPQDVKPEAIFKLIDTAIYVQEQCAKNLHGYESRVACEHSAVVLKNLKTMIQHLLMDARTKPPG